MAEYIMRPGLFVREVLKAEPDDWQDKALDAYARHHRIAIRAGHGVGKTAWQAWTVIHFLVTRPFPKVPCTAPTRQQLMDVLWPEIAKWLMNAPELEPLLEWQKTRVVMRQYPERWFATARTSNKPENLSGFHEENMLFIVDEASGVDDRIFEVIDGALTTKGSKLIVCGNPTKTSGRFYDAFHSDRDMYWTMKVSCLDAKMASKDYAERMARKYGIESDVYRVRVAGEFPRGEPDTFIPLEFVEAAAARELEMKEDDPLHIGVDCARFGDDETVLQPRIGPVALPFEFYVRQDTMQTTGRILAMAKRLMAEYNKSECTVKIDDDGVGGGVTDRLREVVKEENLPIEVVDCHNGAKAHDENHYDDWGTEAWSHLRDLLKAGDIQIPNDDDLIGQLSTRKYTVTSKGRIKLESKKDMKKRGLRSPDRADALVLAFAPERRTPAIIDFFDRKLAERKEKKPS
jgi:hypothetical protein